MVFSSRLFLFLFLPAALALHFIAPKRMRNIVLLIVSLLFYSWGEPRQFGLMLVSIVLNHVLGLLAGATRERASGRWVVGVTVVANLALLGYYKYANFLIDAINSVLEVMGTPEIVHGSIALPVGISFYTFQAMSYVIDVYRGEAKAQRNPINTALYISLFPQLIAGPIVRYVDVAAQIDQRTITVAGFAEGIRRFTIGLAKKVLLANSLATAADLIFELPNGGLTFGVAWLGAVCYGLQLYFDFSGYSDMAIGLGEMFGFRFAENFNYPYVSRSITDFWRRWHLSLSTWFRDYLYVPLGGNRLGATRTYMNLLTVFLLCGLWHGANWTFLAWGAFHGAFLIIERAGLSRRLAALPVVVQHLYTLVVLSFGWVLFRVESLGQAAAYWYAMISLGSASSADGLASYLDSGLIIALVAACLAAVPVWGRLAQSVRHRADRSYESGSKAFGLWIDTIGAAARVASLCGLFFASAAALMASTYNPFIYFRF
ncbi:MAG: MBOAT family protein [Planctomycetia bacterium]|nr:MBOAT family protein [Planctomycetia bacterium]